MRAITKAYSSNLTLEQWELLEPLIPAAKPGGRPREVKVWDILNAILYLLTQGCTWRNLPGDFPAWQTVSSYFRTWRQDGTWVVIHDRLRAWVRVVQGRALSPSEAIIDSQSLKSAAMISQAVGYDAGKVIKGRKRFITVDTLGLVLRVLVTAASVGEREGGKQVLKQVKRLGKDVSRLHTIWVDGGFDGRPFIRWVMDVCRWTRAGRVETRALPRLRIAQKALGRRTDFWLANGVSAIGQRLRATTRNFRDVYLPCHDPDFGEAVGIKFLPLLLFKRPLSSTLSI